MTSTDAQGVATNFKNLIAAYSETLANASLTVDFVDYSDSVIELINNGCPDSVVAVCSFFPSLFSFVLSLFSFFFFGFCFFFVFGE